MPRPNPDIDVGDTVSVDLNSEITARGTVIEAKPVTLVIEIPSDPANPGAWSGVVRRSRMFVKLIEKKKED